MRLLGLYNRLIKHFSLSEVLISFLFCIPVILYYVAHFNPPEGIVGTGFVAGDMASYMANARQHFDEGSFHLLYANPFNLDNSGPHIYFQVQTFILGLVWYITQADVGIIFMLFGFVSTFFAIFMALKLFKKFLGWGTIAHSIVFVLFIYGGGILIISGFLFNVVQDKSTLEAALDCLEFDPGGGFWMLNFGRNFVYPTEAFYHFLTISIVYAVISNKQKLLSLMLFILAFSHPFYGIQFLLIILSWQFLEVFLIKESIKDKRYFFINIIILLAFTLYNLIFLNSFPDHQIIIKQWSLNWNLPFISSVLAYGPLFLIFIYQIRNRVLFQKFLSNSNHRFLLIYFIISIILANHELLIKPVQPIHFAHGHIYTSLFLMTASSLIIFFRKKGDLVLQVTKTIVFILLIFDNISWYPAQYYNSMFSERGARLKVSNQDLDLIQFIDNHYDYSYILISENSMLDYLATAYSSTYAILPHGHNTPFVENRKVLYRKVFEERSLNILPNNKLLIVYYLKNGINQFIKTNPNFVEVYRNKQYILYERISNQP